MLSRITQLKRVSLYLLLLLFPFIASCGSSGDKSIPTNSDRAADSIDLRLAVLPLASCLPVYYAEETGLFERMGLHVSLLSYGAQADCDTALLGNWVDGGFSEQLISPGSSSRPLLQTTCPWGVVATPALRLKGAKDLNGRVVAVARGEISEKVALEALESAGLGKMSAMFPQVGNYRIAASMVASGQVDAAALPEPFLSEALKMGCKLIYRGKKDAENILLIKREKTDEKAFHKQADIFLRAYNAAVDSLNLQGMRLTSPLLQSYVGVPAAVADSLHLPKFIYAKKYGE